MTPENQRDEEIKIYYDDEYLTVTEVISKLTPEEIDRGNHCDQTIIDLISALNAQRQSWERMKEALDAIKKEKSSLEDEMQIVRSQKDSDIKMIDDLGIEVVHLRAEKSALEKEKAGLEERVRELEIELSHLKKLEDLDAEAIKEYYAPIYAKKQKIFNLELTRLKSRNEELEEKVRELTTENEQLKAQNGRH